MICAICNKINKEIDKDVEYYVCSKCFMKLASSKESLIDECLKILVEKIDKLDKDKEKGLMVSKYEIKSIKSRILFLNRFTKDKIRL